jgi:ABC-type antimicrobial peptide transport system permease subunit
MRVATLSQYFAGLAILIACLGLFGLAAFTAERRTKEIGIRKTLGATRSGIVLLLSKDFTKMVLLGIIIAIPLSYYAATTWLEGFAYHTELKIPIFLLAGFIALFIAWATIGFQAIRAASVNPIDSLKNN